MLNVAGKLALVDGKLLKKWLSLLLSGLMLYPCAPAFAKGLSKQERRDAHIKAAVLSLGVGQDARVWATLLDKRRVKGYVAQASNDSFLIGKFYASDVT
jgi:hypothetical protein